MNPAGFEPAVPASEWPQTYALDRAAIGIGKEIIWLKSEPDMDCHKEKSVILQLMQIQDRFEVTVLLRVGTCVAVWDYNMELVPGTDWLRLRFPE
jgi:hypothetical protein